MPFEKLAERLNFLENNKMEAWKSSLINDPLQQEKRLKKWQELGFGVMHHQALGSWEELLDLKHKFNKEGTKFQEVEDIEFPGEVDTEGEGVPIVESIYVSDRETMYYIVRTNRESR